MWWVGVGGTLCAVLSLVVALKLNLYVLLELGGGNGWGGQRVGLWMGGSRALGEVSSFNTPSEA